MAGLPEKPVASLPGGSEDSDNPDGPECPICLQPCMHPVELPCHHVFCFLCIKGAALQGNSKCAICRAAFSYTLLNNPNLKDASQLLTESKTASGYQWYYESRGGGWWQYDERTMNDLEREYSSNKPTCQLLVAGHIYIVDFSQMIQYRSNNRNISRRIRREQNSLEKRGVAGIRLTTSAAAPSTSNNGSSPPPQPQGPASGTRRRRVNPPAAVSNPPGSAAPSSSSRPPTAHGDSPVQAVVLSSDEDSSVDVDEDYDSDYSDADDDMEIGEEEEALIGDDSDERETEDEEEIESRDGARAPTRRSDRSNSSNNQTPPPPSGGSVTNGSSRTYSPTSRGGSRGHRSGRSSGGGSRNGNGNSQSSSRSCPGSDPNTSSLLLLTNTYNLDPQININLNNNVYIDPQLRDSPISTISNVKVSFEKSSHRGREEFL